MLQWRYVSNCTLFRRTCELQSNQQSRPRLHILSQISGPALELVLQLRHFKLIVKIRLSASIHVTFSGRTMALVPTQPVTEMSTRLISWASKRGRRVGLTNFMCWRSIHSGSLNLLQPSGPIHACIGTALPLIAFMWIGLNIEWPCLNGSWFRVRNISSCIFLLFTDCLKV
jgi:hypothetical protein